jgi:hypothetical protein
VEPITLFFPDRPNRVSDIVVELTGSQLTYMVGILDAKRVASSSPRALVIDLIGCPLSPVSVAGIQRRARR